MPYRSRVSHFLHQARFMVAGAVLGLAPGVMAVTTATNTPSPVAKAVPPLILSGKQSTRPAGTYSAGIGELVQMLDAKVEGQVIVAFIQNSSIPYNPDAADLMALKEHGASTEVLEALLHHGDQLRLQLAQALMPTHPQTPAPLYESASEEVAAPVLSDPPAATSYPAYGYYGPWPGGISRWNHLRPYRDGYEHSRRDECQEGARHSSETSSPESTPWTRHSVVAPGNHRERSTGMNPGSARSSGFHSAGTIHR